tara:strand:- start:296 stop:520 length:225 start_codon:yes stop_codon:yes gene_type:complete
MLHILLFYQRLLIAMEQKKSQEQQAIKIPKQRKTTLKWGTNGELSSIDMVRILDRLNDQDLTECEIPLKTEKKL